MIKPSRYEPGRTGKLPRELLNRYTVNSRIVGSNPIPSATSPEFLQPSFGSPSPTQNQACKGLAIGIAVRGRASAPITGCPAMRGTGHGPDKFSRLRQPDAFQSSSFDLVAKAL